MTTPQPGQPSPQGGQPHPSPQGGGSYPSPQGGGSYPSPQGGGSYPSPQGGQYGAPQGQPYGGGYGGGGYSGGIPREVNTAAILLFVAGGFSILGGLLLFAFLSFAGFLAAVAIILLLIGGFEIYTGVALRQLKPWARTAAMVLAGIGALFALISLIQGGFTSIISLGLNVYVLYLMTRPVVTQAFESRA